MPPAAVSSGPSRRCANLPRRMAGLRIGVNALYLIPGGVGGTEIYLRSLLAAVAEIDHKNEYVLFTNRETTNLYPSFRTALQPVPATNRPARIAWEQTGLPVAVARERIDVLFNPGFTGPALCPCPTVTVFHDLQHKRHPEHFRWFDLPFWRLTLFQSATTSDAIVAVSDATRRDFLRYYPVEPERVHVVPHGVDERMFSIGREPEAMVLCVSTLHPHKNLDRLVRAFAAFRTERPEFRLVLAGMRGFHSEAVERQVAAFGLGEAVQITGWISRSELYDLYRRAHAFVYPSTFEGFGMPVLEALAAGIPTACSAISPVREVVGEAAELFDPDDEASMLDALHRISCEMDLRTRLAAAGPERASQFSWRQTAKRTVAILCETAR